MLFRIPVSDKVQLSLIVIAVLVLLQILITSSEKTPGTSNANQNNRKKRQTGDIIFMGYKAKGALKSTTRPADYFRRIGKKKWSRPSLPASLDVEDAALLQGDMDRELFIDAEDYLQRWR